MHTFVAFVISNMSCMLLFFISVSPVCIGKPVMPANVS